MDISTPLSSVFLANEDSVEIPFSLNLNLTSLNFTSSTAISGISTASYADAFDVSASIPLEPFQTQISQDALTAQLAASDSSLLGFPAAPNSLTLIENDESSRLFHPSFNHEAATPIPAFASSSNASCFHRTPANDHRPARQSSGSKRKQPIRPIHSHSFFNSPLKSPGRLSPRFKNSSRSTIRRPGRMRQFGITRYNIRSIIVKISSAYSFLFIYFFIFVHFFNCWNIFF